MFSRSSNLLFLVNQSPEMKKERILSPAVWSYILLVAVVFTAFFVTFFPLEWHKMFYRALFTVIYLSAIYNMEKHRKQVLLSSLLVLVMNWISGFFELPLVGYISKTLNIIFFLYIVGALVRQVARAKTVTAKVIMEAINGYLLIGISFAVLVAIVGEVDPSGFNFHSAVKDDPGIASRFSDDLYYTYITMATVGYGDMLPLKPVTKSLATLIGITGQLYIAIIIAMLVGKFASQKNQ
jgi:voltage-gated potassium channel